MMPRPSGQQRAAVHQQAANPLLRLLPSQFPTLPHWSDSDFAQLAGRDKDNQVFCIHVFHEILYLGRVCMMLPAPVRATLTRNCTGCLVLNLLHAAMRLALPDAYATCRWILVIHRRIYYTLGHISNLQGIYDVAARPAHTTTLTSADFDPVFTHHLLSGATTSPATLLRSLLIGSSALWNLIHAAPFPAPLALELPLQLAYLWANYYYLSQLATSYFSAPRYVPAATSLCHAIAALTQPPWLPPPPNAPTSLSTSAHICDTPQRTWVLTLFLQLFVGFFLTLYIGWLFEGRLKLRYQQHLRRTSLAAPASSSAPPAPTTTTTTATSPPLATTTAAGIPASTPTPTPNPPFNAAATNIANAAPSTTTTPAATMRPGPSTPTATPTPNPHAVPPPRTLLQSTRSALASAATAVNTPLLRHLLRQLGATCQHALRLWLLATVAWTLVVACRGPLARSLRVAFYAGAELEWYWEHVCGGDRWPCCPAVHGH